MTILQANLKHLYQRRGLLILGMLLLAFGVLMVATGIVGGRIARKDGAFALPAYWMLIVGMFLAAQCMDVLTKPFAYCLPGHRPLPRKVLFYVGWSLSILWSLPLLAYPGLGFGKAFLACMSAFLMFTMSYWLGVWFVFRFKNWSPAIGFIPLLVFGGNLMDLPVRIEYLIVRHWPWMLLFGSLVNVLAWIRWGRTDMARQYCGTLWLGGFDAWNKEKMTKFKEAKLAKIPAGISPGVEDFFVSRISMGQGHDLKRYIWGSLYKSFGMLLSPRRQECVWLLALWFALAVYLGYFSGTSNMLFFIPGFIVIQMRLPVRSNMLICGGRRERFWSAMVLAIGTAAIITVLTTVCGLLTLSLESVMPDLPLKGMAFEYHAMDVRSFFFVPLLMVPISLTCGLFGYKMKLFGLVAMAMYMSSLVGTIAIVTRNQSITFSPVLVAAALLCCWAAFVSILHHICMKRSLV